MNSICANLCQDRPCLRICILGKSGAGKTTFLNTILNDLPRDLLFDKILIISNTASRQSMYTDMVNPIFIQNELPDLDSFKQVSLYIKSLTKKPSGESLTISQRQKPETAIVAPIKKKEKRRMQNKNDVHYELGMSGIDSDNDENSENNHDSSETDDDEDEDDDDDNKSITSKKHNPQRKDFNVSTLIIFDDANVNIYNSVEFEQYVRQGRHFNIHMIMLVHDILYIHSNARSEFAYFLIHQNKPLAQEITNLKKLSNDRSDFERTIENYEYVKDKRYVAFIPPNCLYQPVQILPIPTKTTSMCVSYRYKRRAAYMHAGISKIGTVSKEKITTQRVDQKSNLSHKQRKLKKNTKLR